MGRVGKHGGSEVELGSCCLLKVASSIVTACVSMQHHGQGKTVMVYSLLQELARRDGLTIALSGRNEEELYPILKYLSRHMTKPRFIPLLLDVGNMLIGTPPSTSTS